RCDVQGKSGIELSLRTTHVPKLQNWHPRTILFTHLKHLKDFEVTCAKSLVDIASMLKEIKEGQQLTPTILKRQPDAPQQTPAKHCGICSCNSHHTDECPQLQEGNTVELTHNFFEGTTIPPYNKQYYTQRWRDNQPTRWSPPQ
ncbi:hypothetical protein PIB30_096001, partial [Stylosanthes scabra]|nr:hypothetical protein [Stylosanthes scabra]